jgi:hypothetical protein
MNRRPAPEGTGENKNLVNRQLSVFDALPSRLLVIFSHDANYRFLTPQKKKAGFRKQKTEWIRNLGARNR